MTEQDYTYWTQALIRRKQGLVNDLPMQEGNPQAGYYKIRDGHKTAPWMAIAIWREDDGWVVEPHQYSNGRPFTAEDIWTYACHNPIEYETEYVPVAEQGLPWPEAIEPAPKSNMAGMTEAERLRAEVEDLREQAEAWLASLDNLGQARTKTEADKAINYADRFAALEKEATIVHKTEKEPHLEAGKAVDRTYFPIRDQAAMLKRTMKGATLAYAQAEDKRRQERAEKTHMEAEPVKLGSGGRRASLREKKVYVIENMQLVLDYFAKMDPMPFILVEALQKLVDDVGTKCPGVAESIQKTVI